MSDYYPPGINGTPYDESTERIVGWALFDLFGEMLVDETCLWADEQSAQAVADASNSADTNTTWRPAPLLARIPAPGFAATPPSPAESAEGPTALLGFPEGEPTPRHDLIYPGATKLPGFKYRPVWSLENHPDAVRQRAKPAESAERCPHCDDTGDVHRADGEWMGRCDCPAAAPSQVSDADALLRECYEWLFESKSDGARVSEGALSKGYYTPDFHAFHDRLKAALDAPTHHCGVDGTWLWGRLMDWCKSRGAAPANYDSLFAIANEAHKLAAQPQPGRVEGMVLVPWEKLEEARDLLLERRCVGNARSPAHNARLVLDDLLGAARTPPAPTAGGDAQESDHG